MTDITNRDEAAYTTTNVAVSPLFDPVLPEHKPEYNILTLMKILLESKGNPFVLPTYFPNKTSPDLLVETYAKFAGKIVQEAPSYITVEAVSQKIREALRQQVRDAYGVNIPGTFGFSNSDGYIPIKLKEEMIAEVPKDLPFYACLVTPTEIPEVTEDTAKAHKRRASKGKINGDKDTMPLIEAGKPQKSVAGTTAAWLSDLNRLLLTHNYRRQPDIATTEMRILDYKVLDNQRNPQDYPHIVILCTVDLSFVLDVFVNNARLELFHYENQRVNTLSLPTSLKTDPTLGVVTTREFTQYGAGLAMALIKIRLLVQDARVKSKNQHVLSEITNS